MEQGVHDALVTLLGAKVAGGVVAVVGLTLMLFGWLRGRGGRALGRGIIALSDDSRSLRPPPLSEEERTISRGEWHDLRDRLNRAVWDLDQAKRELEGLNRDMEKLEGAHNRDHDRIESIIVDITHMKAKLSGWAR